MEYETALERLKTLQGHVQMTKEAKKEISKASFDLSQAQKAIWKAFPQEFFQILECAELVNATDETHIWDTIEEEKEEAQRAMVDIIKKMFELKYTTPQEIAKNIDKFTQGASAMACVNNSSNIKYQVQLGMYCKAIRLLGSQKHYDDLIRGCSLTDIGAFCLTEVGHGSNISALETTATYDKETGGFILNTPTQFSVKTWATNLGKYANKAIVFAQLVIKKRKYGIHAFLIDVRNSSGQPLPGLKIGEIGLKKSSHGIDAGHMQIMDYFVPKYAMLDRFCSINNDGKYESKLDAKTGHMPLIQSILTSCRIALSHSSAISGIRAATIAIRYGAMRRQFSFKPKEQEQVILDYTGHQYRLFPGFCESLVNIIGLSHLSKEWIDLGYTAVNKLSDEDKESLAALSALACSAKAFSVWTASTVADQSRQASGGNGYSKFALFGNIIEAIDVAKSSEGDNNVILLSTARFLIDKLEKAKSAEFSSHPSLTFIKPTQKVASGYSLSCFRSMRQLLADRANQQKLEESSSDSKRDDLEDQHQFQVKKMCQAWFDFYVADKYVQFLDTITHEPTKKVFQDIFRLYFLSKIENEADYFRDLLGDEEFDAVRGHITTVLKRLRSEMVYFTQALPFPDKIMGVWGAKDLDGYSRFLRMLHATPAVEERPYFWKMIYQNN